MSEFILYSYFRSSASYRVRIALNLKNAKYDYRAIHLLKDGGEQHKDDYKKLNPSEQVPTLIHNGKAIGQSMAIIQYLEDVIDSPRLFPATPIEKARVIQFCEIINSGIQPLHNVSVTEKLGYFGLDEKSRGEWNAYWIDKGLAALETILKESAGTYSFGGQITAADVFLVPQVVSARRFGGHPDNFPTLMHVFENCNKLEAFQKAEPSKQPDAV
jgi:maleylacetoacetate isomerase